jgi:hypothetical protein
LPDRVKPDMFTFNISNTYTGMSEAQHLQLVALIGDVRADLQLVISKENQIMATQVEIDAALGKIDAATTQQGTVLTAQAASLQKISDEMDGLIAAGASGGLTAAQFTRLQTLADSAQTVATNLTAQAAVSTAIASKGASNPVPVPVPVPTPVA